jgi:hypothetical protein
LGGKQKKTGGLGLVVVVSKAMMRGLSGASPKVLALFHFFFVWEVKKKKRRVMCDMWLAVTPRAVV